MIQKPTLLIDMDGIFCDFLTGYYNILETKYPHARQWFPEPDELTKFYVSDNLLDPRGKPIEELVCNDPQLFASLPPFPEAIDGMKRLLELCLVEGVELYICTAPHMPNPNCYTQKAIWVRDHLGPDWLERLIITRDKTVVRGDVLLDDKPDPLGSQIPNWKHVLFTRSYNRDIMGKPRMDDWSQASLEFLVSITKQVNHGEL